MNATIDFIEEMLAELEERQPECWEQTYAKLEEVIEFIMVETGAVG